MIISLNLFYYFVLQQYLTTQRTIDGWIDCHFDQMMFIYRLFIQITIESDKKMKKITIIVWIIKLKDIVNLMVL